MVTVSLCSSSKTAFIMHFNRKVWRMDIGWPTSINVKSDRIQCMYVYCILYLHIPKRINSSKSSVHRSSGCEHWVYWFHLYIGKSKMNIFLRAISKWKKKWEAVNCKAHSFCSVAKKKGESLSRRWNWCTTMELIHLPPELFSLSLVSNFVSIESLGDAFGTTIYIRIHMLYYGFGYGYDCKVSIPPVFLFIEQ